MMPYITKELVNDLIETLDVYGVGAHHPDLLLLLDQPEDEPVATVLNRGEKMLRVGVLNAEGMGLTDGTKLYTHPPAPEIHGSDWFYKLKFICRVLEGSRPANGDVATALGMARSLFNEKHSEGMTAPRITELEAQLTAPVKPITAEDVTDEMLLAYLDALAEPMNYRDTLAAAVNAYLTNLETL